MSDYQKTNYHLLKAENERLRKALELEEMSLAVCNDKACELLAKNERLQEALRYARQICVQHGLHQTLEVIEAALQEGRSTSVAELADILGTLLQERREG